MNTPQWRPIDTAPKDGADILVGGFSPSLFGQKWTSVVIHWSRSHGVEGWDCRNFTEAAFPGFTFTHWMPIPQPPSL